MTSSPLLTSMTCSTEVGLGESPPVWTLVWMVALTLVAWAACHRRRLRTHCRGWSSDRCWSTRRRRRLSSSRIGVGRSSSRWRRSSSSRRLSVGRAVASGFGSTFVVGALVVGAGRVIVAGALVAGVPRGLALVGGLLLGSFDTFGGTVDFGI